MTLKTKQLPEKLDRPALEKVARVFAAFADPTRLAILQELKAGERAVGEIVDSIGISQGNVSKQLQLLFDVGLLHRERRGTQVFYSIRDEMVMPLCELVCDKLNRDQEEAATLNFQI